MRDGGPLHVLKRKLSFHPLSRDKVLKEKKLRSVYSQDNLGSHYNTHVPPPAYQKYPVLKLNDNLSLSIGDSFEPNPRTDLALATRFEYGSIRSPKLIRLLLILPASDQDEPLETLIFHADLNEVPFQALSYAEGDVTKQKKVHCNGRKMSMQENLHASLLAVRNLGDAKAISIVWAEAVCVNHGDVKEREVHLKLMRDIYSSTVVTTIYLGGTDAQRGQVFETIDKLHEACQVDEFRDRLEGGQLDLSSLDHLSIGEKTLEIPYENRMELTRFFSHSWFERIWIFQEVAAAKKAFILYGGGVRPWTYLVDAAYCMHHLHWGGTIMPDSFNYGDKGALKHGNVLHLEEYRNGVMAGHSFKLLELLTATRGFKSNEPLDRVFGLYGLLGEKKEKEIVTHFFDYKLPPLSLFLNLCINLILTHDTLDVFHLVNNNPSSRSGWPSFIPDFACQNTARQMGSRRGRPTWEYWASKDTTPLLRIINGRDATGSSIPYFDDDVHIALTGLIIDEVCRNGTEMKESGMNIGSFLGDWVNTALMSNGRKWYTKNELTKAREALSKMTKDDGGIVPAAANGSRRPSITAETGRGSRRGSESTEGQKHLRNSFAPSLLDAIHKIEASADSPTLSSFDAVTVAAFDASVSSLPDTPYPVGDITSVEAFWRTLIRDREEDGSMPASSVGATHFEPWFKAASGSMTDMVQALEGGQDHRGDRPVAAFNNLVRKASTSSKIIKTRNGYIGSGPRWVEEGDLVCVLYGAQTPFVLRREAWGNYRFIGDCYIHGIMHGEALDMDFEDTEFVLV